MAFNVHANRAKAQRDFDGYIAHVKQTHQDQSKADSSQTFDGEFTTDEPKTSSQFNIFEFGEAMNRWLSGNS